AASRFPELHEGIRTRDQRARRSGAHRSVRAPAAGISSLSGSQSPRRDGFECCGICNGLIVFAQWPNPDVAEANGIAVFVKLDGTFWGMLLVLRHDAMAGAAQ